MNDVKRMTPYWSLLTAESVSGLKVKENKVAIATLGFYIDGMVEQWERITKDERDADEQSAMQDIYIARGDSSKAEEAKTLFWTYKHGTIVDIHLYAICGDKVSALMEIITRREKNDRLTAFWTEWKRRLFTEIRQLRVMFEHPNLYLEKNWDRAYFEVFFQSSTLILRGRSFDLSVIEPENVVLFFRDLIRLLSSPAQHQRRNREDSQHP